MRVISFRSYARGPRPVHIVLICGLKTTTRDRSVVFETIIFKSVTFDFSRDKKKTENERL